MMPNYGLRIGAGAIDNVDDAKRCHAGPDSAHYMTCEYPEGTYHQVSPGKKFHVTKVVYSAAAANGNFQIGYGDDGVPDQAGAPTAPKVVSGKFYSLVANAKYSEGIDIIIPAEKFPFIKSIAERCYVQLYGFEIT